jgi:hypothetical protein
MDRYHNGLKWWIRPDQVNLPLASPAVIREKNKSSAIYGTRYPCQASWWTFATHEKADIEDGLRNGQIEPFQVCV